MGQESAGSRHRGGSGQEVFRLKEDLSEKKNHCRVGPPVFLRHTDRLSFQQPAGRADSFCP